MSKAWALSLGLVAASPAWAIGFGRVPDSIVFGQPLDLSVPLRLEAGEGLPPGCLRAEVWAGEQRLPPASLRVALDASHDGQGVVRVRSAQAVLEPVVTVEIAAGCPQVVSRRFVLLADPPAHVEPVVATVSVDGPARVAPPGSGPAPEVSMPGQPAGSRDPRMADAKPAAVAAAPAPRRPTRRAVAAESAAKAPKAARTPVARAKAVEPEKPRLQLESAEARLQQASLAVARQDAAMADAAAAASAAQAAASASEARLAAMENRLQQVQAESQASRAALEQMRERLARAEARNAGQPLYWAVLAALAALAAGLAWRLRRAQREAQAGWWQPAAGAEAAMPTPDEASPSEAAALAPGAALPDAAPGRPLPLRPPLIEPVAERSSVLGALADDAAGRRPVTADELIDLEQQAEFFIVLGEEESAVDLLLAHLRSTGGTSPMPYLKLLEIYRRRGDQDAYERLRHRFNLRFNAYAPDWQQGLDAGRGLLDYPQVTAQLVASWPAPVDAMAELENLLFRKHAGELFDLPAYRDVLMLYAVARDLLRQAGSATPHVDVLLPLLAGQAHDPQPAAPFITAAMPTASGFATLDEERPTSPVDLDLSAADEPAPSLSAPLTPVTASLRRDNR